MKDDVGQTSIRVRALSFRVLEPVAAQPVVLLPYELLFIAVVRDQDPVEECSDNQQKWRGYDEEEKDAARSRSDEHEAGNR